MVRPLRVEYAGALDHLIARGDARTDIFADDHDRGLFLELLGKEIAQQRWRCYASCLMGNHYHLLIETPEPNLVASMRRLNGVSSPLTESDPGVLMGNGTGECEEFLRI